MLRCGLLGEKLGHSYSPAIHARLGDYSYQLFACPREDLARFLQSGEFDGLNVTIPYKKAVIPYCTALSDAAGAVGSVNTIVRRGDGALYGDNTDVFGFACMLRRSGVPVRGKKAIVLGSGGASAAVCAVLRAEGAREVRVISRTGADNYSNLDRHADAEVIVNATPVGMYPNNGASPVDLQRFPKLALVLDVIYNPARTALLLQAEELGIPNLGGLHMLVAQAKRSSEIFTGTVIDDARIDEIESALSRRMRNIILIGMPGSGKSTLARMLGETLHREVLDADEAIVRAAGMPIPEFFARYGEESFRRQETAVLRELGKRSGAVIATGGGCVTRTENYALLHQNGTILWLRRALDQLSVEGRPLSQRGPLEEMYAAREALYVRFADISVDNDGDLEQTLRRMLDALGESGAQKNR